MSIAVLRKKTKFKSRATSNRVSYRYTGQPKGLAYRGFVLNMTGRGSVTGTKFNNGNLIGSGLTCGQCITAAAANERQSSCTSCNGAAVAKQQCYGNYLRRATVNAGSEYKANENCCKQSRVRGRVNPGRSTHQIWKRAPTFDESNHIDNKKSATIQCTTATSSARFPHGGSGLNSVYTPCNVVMMKTTYTRMTDIPCPTQKTLTARTAADQIARVKARRVCKAVCAHPGQTDPPCDQHYESSTNNNNNPRIC